MFENISEKIKTAATVINIAGIALSILMGIIVMIVSFFSGLIILIGGFFSSWVGSLVLYGFAEIIEYLQVISYNTRKKDQSEFSNLTPSSNYTVTNYKPMYRSNTKTIRCPDCRQEIPNNTQKCPYCGCDVQKYK